MESKKEGWYTSEKLMIYQFENTDRDNRQKHKRLLPEDLWLSIYNRASDR